MRVFYIGFCVNKSPHLGVEKYRRVSRGTHACPNGISEFPSTFSRLIRGNRCTSKAGGLKQSLKPQLPRQNIVHKQRG